MSDPDLSFISTMIRPEILALSAYHVPSSEGMVKLDAMENPFTLPEELQTLLAEKLSKAALNRYPVPSYTELKNALKHAMGVPQGFDLVLGNGSDELISMLTTAVAKPGAKILAPVPGFVMYAMAANFAGVEFIGVPFQADFTLDLPAMLAAIAEHRPALTYLAYPNNPTGTLYSTAEIEQILQAAAAVHGIVVIDEAYQPFAQASFMSRVPEYANLVLMRTVSKLGLAGIRLGYMTAHPVLLAELEKVRPPYNINVLTQTCAEFVLQHVAVLDAQAAQLREQREILALALNALPDVQVFPSLANFLLIRVPDAEQIIEKLLNQKILVKNVGKMHALLKNCLRITVSNAAENAAFLAALKNALPSSAASR